MFMTKRRKLAKASFLFFNLINYLIMGEIFFSYGNQLRSQNLNKFPNV